MPREVAFTPQPTLSNPARSPEVLNLLLRLANLSLSLGLHETALFIAERYSCLCPVSEEAIFLHSLSLLRCGVHRQALELLKSTIVNPPPQAHPSATSRYASDNAASRRPACEASVRCAWVYAEACIALDRPNEGGECLKRAFMVFGNEKLSSPDHFTMVSGSASQQSSTICVNLSLAKLAAAANMRDVAAQRYHEVLRTAWWCWEAFEGLCKIGHAPTGSQYYSAIPVPVVEDLSDRQQDPPAASFLAAPPVDFVQNGRRSPSVQGQNRDAASSSTSQSYHDQPSASLSSQSSYFRTSTPNAPGERGQSLFVNGFRGNGKADSASRPIESQGAAFKLDEEEEMDDDGRRRRAISREPSVVPDLSTHLEDAQIGNDSSFWGPGRVDGRQGQAELGAALFGIAPKAKSDTKRGSLFGQGLLFGQATPATGDASRSGNAVSNGGSFFTPVHHQAASGSSRMPGGDGQDRVARTSRMPNGRPAPAIKRNIHQLDETTPEDSFQFQVGPHRRPPAALQNGRSRQESADAEEVLVSRELGGDESDALGGARNEDGLPKAGYVRQTSQLWQTAGHRNNANQLPFGSTTAKSTFAPKGNRIVSNPRDRKRSKAGPSSYDDASTATTASSSHSVDTQSGLHTGSSSPPAAAYSENAPQFVTFLPTTAHIEPHVSKVAAIPAESVIPARMHSASSAATGPISQPLAYANSTDRQALYRQQLEAAQSALAENWLRNLFRHFAKAYGSESRYESAATIKAVFSLPKEQRNSPRAILLLGRAHFESLDYVKAEQAFDAVRGLAPYHTAGLEVYSTLLWHLHRPMHLSFLSQELLAISPRLPQGWIATGNVFSHLEDHPNALKCFKRAIQCDPNFSYAYTLAGHESATMEEWEVAVGFFREAIRKHTRHYNAWFGLGNVYMKTGKHRMAEYHFRKAVDINPSNAMLVCCVGAVLEKLDRKKEALEMYERACLLAPTSPAVRFKRVRMLVELKHYDSALRDLMLVRDMAPDEFNVHYLLGKLYGAMGDRTNMTRNLTIAQDLEPRAAGRIRELIESVDEPDEDEDEEAGAGDATGQIGEDDTGYANVHDTQDSEGNVENEADAVMG